MTFGMSLISSSLLPPYFEKAPQWLWACPYSVAAWCHFAKRLELPARLPDKPGIIYLLGHPPHLSLLLPTVWNWRTSVSSGCDASFFHVVNSELSRWRSQAALLLCNSHLTPECSTSVKAMAAKLFFSDRLLTTPTGWWRAWSGSRVAGHSSHYSSTAMPGAHYPLASEPLKSTPHSWVGGKHNNGNQDWWNVKPVLDRVWGQGRIQENKQFSGLP